ncbi:DUF1697 domain-containing protein [Draconibacterium sp. IB214405]|uniref:DUF1697 domain-containing protein n=1 Tax=Draconibacterium sp. IB214405 TaxID=3097352 RepID=UPI002A0F7274|nr:DUF1697 domain-containing protein [Draconibacterium sp. IB214405]MDX8340597.1 DUF1697 domain-containing protein [Draconibacterium sp. IB214405]
MKTYVAILRGINVSGKNKIKMDALKSSFSRLGFEQVHTYIQSGNVVFSYPESRIENLEKLITKQIFEDFGFDVPVLILSEDQLANIVENNPFIGKENIDHQFLHVTFLKEIPSDVDEEKITSHLKAGEEFVISEGVVYLYCPHGYGKTKLTNNFFENQLKVSATTRNWKTTQKLLEMANEI